MRTKIEFLKSWDDACYSVPAICVNLDRIIQYGRDNEKNKNNLMYIKAKIKELTNTPTDSPEVRVLRYLGINENDIYLLLARVERTLKRLA